MNHTHVIIGAGAAGMAAATAIRETDRNGRVIVLSEEADRPYFRPMIPFIISGKKTAAQVSLEGEGPYPEIGLDIRLASRVQEVDTHNKTVTTAGETIAYDRLLIASGSSPYLPPDIDGLGLEGVYPLRTLAQANHAAARSSWAKTAVLLGGGLLNLKAAFALLERKIAVTLVVRSPEILSQLMEPADARLIRQALRQAGLRIMTGRSAAKVVGNERGVHGVMLDNRTAIPCDMVFVGKGVRPNTAFLAGSGLAGQKGGVAVDGFTRTKAADIFAAGDVAVTFDPSTGKSVVTGLWTNAAEMGRCAGRNMAGRPTAYTGTFGVMNATQVAGLPFVSMGTVHPDGQNFEVHTASAADSYRKLVFSRDGSRLVGLVMIGRIEGAGLYRYLIRENRDIRHHKARIIAGSLHAGNLTYDA